MSRYLRTVALAICLGTACHTFGAQPTITRSSLSALLQQPTVSAIHRDSRGVFWLGTEQGLHRFDGANLHVFDSNRDNSNWIPDSRIEDIAEDHSRNLLVATSSGFLLKLDPQTETFHSVNQFGPVGSDGSIRLLVSKQGGIWLLSKNGLMLFDPMSEVTVDWVKNLNLLESIGSLHDIVEDGPGNLWVAGSTGLAKVMPSSKSFVSFDTPTFQLPAKSRVTALKMDGEANLIIGTDIGQLTKWNTSTGKTIAAISLSRHASHHVSEFLEYGDTLIVATDRGLFATDKQLSFVKNLTEKHHMLSNSAVYSLFSEGKSLWIGTMDGLDILSFAPIELFESKNIDINSGVLAIAQDTGRDIWLGTYSGLYHYDENTGTHTMLDSHLSASDDQRVSTIATRKNELWLGFLQGGVQVIDTRSGTARRPNLNHGNRMAITKILADDNSDDVWIASYDHGLFRITASKLYSYYERQSLPEKRILSLLRSTTSIFLALSENTVYKHDPRTDQFSEISFEFGLGETSPVIYSFAQASNDEILIGTKDYGLFVWSRENQLRNNMKLQQADASSGISTSTIYGIEPDSEGNIWCSTQNGIVKLDAKGNLIKRFTIADGLQGNDFTMGASFTSREGLIYFGGANGYNRIDPAEVIIDRSASPLMLTDISLPSSGEKDLGPVHEIRSLALTHKDRFVTFQFSVLDFTYPEKNRFRYKLENFDPDWIDSGTRNSATYTNLPAGKYVFRVQGANSAGIWNRDGLTIDVNVLPPPWLTWWAFLIYGISLLFLVWVTRRIYHSYVADRRAAQLERDKIDIENKSDDDMQEQLELQDELVKSAYQHNLTTLSLISDCISHRGINQSDLLNRDLSECNINRIAALSSLEDCLYYDAGGPFANLHKYTDSIIPIVLQSSPIRPETIISINEVSSALIPAKLASPLSVIIYELLENCMLHAFEEKSPANYILISMTQGATHGSATDHLELTVRDNGIGISDSVDDQAYDGSGIGIVKSIVEKLGGNIQFSGKSGTTVSITISNPEDTLLSNNSLNST